MKNSALLGMMVLVAATWCEPTQAGVFFGAGAAFPKPVYLAWGRAYKELTGNPLIFNAVGSGKGISEIMASKTDFGATDMPVKQEELEKNSLVQFPTVIGGVVPAINIKGIGDAQLQLDGATLSAIFLGKITHWNDPALAALNPGLTLPKDAITVVHRSDKSGATFYLTNYLSKVSGEWKASQGEGLTISWATGVGMDSSENVAQKIAETPYSIGYVDYVMLKKRNLISVKLKNQDGVWIAANDKSFSAAATAAKWSAATGFYEILTNQSGKDSWPITSATFALVERTPTVTENVEVTLKFFDWAYSKGDAIAIELGYVPLPDNVAELVRNAWKTQIKSRAGTPLWK
jgi:phosphate transport system substrate-binding protein